MNWVILGESVAGTSHITRNLPCEDAHSFCHFGRDKENLAVVVADGAGSALHGQIGAALVCRELVQRLTDPERTGFSREEFVSVILSIQQIIAVEAANLDVEPRQLACTSLVSIVFPEYAVFAQIGDGAIVVRSEETCSHEVVFWPEPEGYANCTNFITDEDFEKHLHFERRDVPPIELAIFTDGIQRLALDFSTKAAFSGFFFPLFGGLSQACEPTELSPHLVAFLTSERVNSRTDDDKTIVLAARRR